MPSLPPADLTMCSKTLDAWKGTESVTGGQDAAPYDFHSEYIRERDRQAEERDAVERQKVGVGAPEEAAAAAGEQGEAAAEAGEQGEKAANKGRGDDERDARRQVPRAKREVRTEEEEEALRWVAGLCAGHGDTAPSMQLLDGHM